MLRTMLTDLLTGKNVYSIYKEYVETQWLSDGEILDYQIIKLRKLLEHCYKNVPFYRSYMLNNGLTPSDFNTVDDLKKLPVIDKELIKSNYELFIPDNISAIKGVKYGQTGGTTGSILKKRTDANVRSSTWATFRRYYDWMGVKEGEKVLRLMGGHILKDSFKSRLRIKVNELITNTKSFNPYNSSDENLNGIIQYIKNNNVKLIKGYSQNLFFIGKFLNNKGITLTVPKISTTAEPLLPEHRKLFKEVFNAESFDQYGCGEIGGIAYECDHHNGLHVSHERVILEVENNNDIIITDLDNYAMPYLRYYNADQVILSKSKCTCGRNGMLIEKVLGRTCDYLTATDGKQLHWAYLWHLLFDTKVAMERNLIKFQVIQKSKGEFDFKIVSDPLTTSDMELLGKLLSDNLGDVKINFLQVNDIENSASGKFRPVINATL